MDGLGEYPTPPLDLALWALDRWGEGATREAAKQARTLALRGNGVESAKWLGVVQILTRLN